MTSGAIMAAGDNNDTKRSMQEKPAYKVVVNELRFLQSGVKLVSDDRWSLDTKVVKNKPRKK